MKRLTALILALITVFALCACGDSSANEKVVEKASGSSSSSQNTQDNDTDLISVEEFSITDRGWRIIKVRNLSGNTVPCFILNYVFIDNNGDIIDTTGHIVTDRIMIDDGQAFSEQDQHVMVDSDYSKVEKVKFTTYTFRDVLNAELRWKEEYSFINPPVFVRNSDGTFSKES